MKEKESVLAGAHKFKNPIFFKMLNYAIDLAQKEQGSVNVNTWKCTAETGRPPYL